ncbi:bifunctional serine/threonine-protein kinase/ABC transporter substrate-binding protein [Streptomyces sp. NBC_01481]|uniref:bifunctional serine/threonine-protein kinase/ABC transporter substrate-binding protein n=1 Tax=Streptomyces sp. NBC_01481 TaxID=2975869 RepID=UPI0022569885|nr:bifunctional serine/threonine-protein kinase/ABC transporter substrate-binding protein [Streptomyces sp. NBC_01481]MCX4584914.1 bifunctional serine/threonine-protein kinase/ABC transporter substrate-binding protein [Streptomyces sp. NBC_01481]
MEPLRTSDPARLADYRLLGRLGAGGMGVVYLARSVGGSLVALKVIQAEYAEDADFRERFRREADTARRMTSPWVASLVDADPGAAAPWLATTFVPGPSLGEAVAAHGPLPQRSLRVLGARLAQALRDLHAVGLVHRDVKPGNVLLALDGPRLIDFGVARDPEDTALTSTGIVVGTPGFLSPEQAQGGRELGPAADIFSLGCVLAFAATGRPPFGTGTLDALLFRAVHDAPDLEGVPQELAEVVGGCLEKDPSLRPTAEALSGTLAVAPPGLGVSPPDPREALRMRSQSSDAPASHVSGDEADWLPESLIRLIAERSAAGLALPGIDDTEVVPGANGSGAAGAPPQSRAVGRRRFLLLAGGATAVTVGGGLAAWATLSGDGKDRGDGSGPASTAARPVHTIGLHADLTGDQKLVGRAQERGLRLAVDEFNSRGDKPFTLAVKTVDDSGDPAKSPAAASQLVADRSVVAVIGPTTDATAQASLATYDAALLPVIAVSPGATVLGVMGSRSFLHARVTDTILPLYLSAYLRGTAKSRTVGIVDDRAADAYAWEISSTLSHILRQGRQPAVPKVVSALRTDFGPTLDALLDGGADSLVFAGHHDRAALLARELRNRDFPGAKAAAQGVLDIRFLSAAGDAAEGWVIVAPVMDSSVAPEAKAFAAAYRKRFGAEPERYAVEAYDVARLAAQTLSTLPAKSVTRKNLTTALRSATYKGITKNFAFNKQTGALVIDGSGVFLWKVTGGRFRFQGVAPYQVST